MGHWQSPRMSTGCAQEQDKFGYFAESTRDAIPGYCFPSNKASGAFQATQGSRLWENMRRHALGDEIATVRCMGFPLARQLPRQLRVEEVFVQPTFEFVPNSLLDHGDTLRVLMPSGLYVLVPTAGGLEAVPVPKVSALGEAISRKKGLVVLGEPGAGKSMVLPSCRSLVRRPVCSVSVEQEPGAFCISLSWSTSWWLVSTRARSSRRFRAELYWGI
jgi:hypothetical protein